VFSVDGTYHIILHSSESVLIGDLGWLILVTSGYRVFRGSYTVFSVDGI